MSRPIFIYCLKDPVTFEVRYVGKTVNPKSRFSLHINQGGNSKKSEWIAPLLEGGLKPIFEILEECDASVWKEREAFHISLLRELGVPIFNVLDGGSGAPHKEEVVEFESVRLRKEIVQKVRDNKVKTGLPIATFFEQAANEKLGKTDGRAN